MGKIRFGRGELIARSAAAGLALLLVLAYFLLPMVNSGSYYNNSGRSKMDLKSGTAYSWAWSPENEHLTRIELKLSGTKKAQETTVQAQVLDENGNAAAEEKRSAAELQANGDSFPIEGNFQKGKQYILTLWTEGEGTLRLRGEEDGEFQPMILESIRTAVHNPALLYFAAGAMLAALTPVCGETIRGRRRRKKAEKQNGWETAMPWVTFALIGGLGIFLSIVKPMPSFGIGEDRWIGFDEEVHWTQLETMSLWSQGGLRYILGNTITWNPGYLPMAVGYNLVRIFTAEKDTLYQAAILCQTLVYAGMCALAVKHAPRYKGVFLAAGAMPTVFFLITSAAFDGMLIASVLLGTALALESADREERISPLRAILMVSLLAFGTVARPAVSLALLTLMIIPGERFGGTKKAWLFRGFVLLMMVWCLAAVLIPGGYDDIWNAYAAGGRQDRMEQISRIMEEMPQEGSFYPLEYAWNHQLFLFVYGISEWNIYGTTSRLNILYLGVMLLLAPLCTVGENKNNLRGLQPGRRLALGAIALGAELMLVYAEYILTLAEHALMQGLQARYFLPMWILMALALTRTRALREKTGRLGNWMMIPTAAVILASDLWWILETIHIIRQG